MQHRNSKPKRILENYALDFFQMWFGNDEGEMMFNNGDKAWMPQSNREYRLWGEAMTESEWFKKILKGDVENGYVSFNNINAVSSCWTSTGQT